MKGFPIRERDMATAKADPNLLKPFAPSGPAVERDRSVKDRNDSIKPKEAVWLEQAAAQESNISAEEVEFFAMLRSRMSEAIPLVQADMFARS